ncbi:hypothetical protein ACFQ1I_43855 [Kitasatospora arboriphila]
MIPATPGRWALLRERAFRRYWLGHTTSLLGSAMASVAVAFAVLGSGGDGTALGAVMAARILPVVLVLPVAASSPTGSVPAGWRSPPTCCAAPYRPPSPPCC